MKGESFDDDGSRFLIGISKKMQGHKRALTESDQKALKQSVDARYYRKAPADHSIHIAAIEGAYDAFKTGKDCINKVFIRMFFRFWIMRYGIGYAIPHFLSRE